MNNNLQPLFMFGFERSGTTLLSMITGAHPDLAVPLTVTGLWYRYYGKLNQYNHLKTDQDVEMLITDLLSEERIKLWDERFSKSEILNGIHENSYPAVIESFHKRYAEKKGKKYWGNLDIVTLDEMDKANSWFPNAKFLHIVRDGRDVALSHETMPYGAANTFDCAQSWERRLTINIKMGEIIGPSRYLIVRYEDLVIKTEQTLIKICDFIGIAYAESMLDYRVMVSEKIPKDRRWLWPALDKKPQKSKCFRWLNKMDIKKRIVFESEAGQMLKALGYETYATVPKRPSAYMYEFWCFIGRNGRLRRIKKKLGLHRKSKLERNWEKNGNQK